MAEPPAEPQVASAATSDTMHYSQATELSAVRAFVHARALTLGLSALRAELLTLAVSELATNTLQHAAGGGRVRVWTQASQLLCDVVDQGARRAFGRAMPPADSVRGRGLAIVERICDDVATSESPDGTLVRLTLLL